MVRVTLQGLEWFSRQYQKIMRPLLVLLYMILTAIVLYAVFMRYVLNAAPSWSEEVARYIMVWAALLSMGIALRQGRHIGLTSLVQRLWGKYTRYAFFVADILMLIFFVVMFIAGISMALFVVRQRSPSVNLPMWVAYASIPAGSFFLIIETLILTLKKLVRQ